MGRARLLALAVVALAGCAPRFDIASFGGGALPAAQQKAITDVVHNPNTAALLTVRRYPWERPAQAWITNLDGKTEFVPLNRDDSTLLDSLGPVESIAGKIQPTIPIAP